MEDDQEKTETRLRNVTTKSNERLQQLEAELDASNVALIGMMTTKYLLIVL